MGKKRTTKVTTLALPTMPGGKGGSVCGREAGRDQMSDISDLESMYSASAAGDLEGSDDENELTNLLETFADQIENAQDKRIEIRIKAIDNLLLVLNKNFVPESVDKWRASIIDIIERNLKRTPEEALRVCSLAALVSLQLGVDIEEEMCQIAGHLNHICVDESANEAVRSACAQTIGLCVFLSVENNVRRMESLQALKGVWSAMKPSKSTGTCLFSSALASWVLLLERLEPSFIARQIDEMQPKICTFLESYTVEARISAGETLAILHEIAVKNIDDTFRFRNHSYLARILADLTVDSSKNRAKRDKKLQKLTFRQISDAICNDRWPQMQVHFNKRETLNLHGCHDKLLYDSLCQLLHSDMNSHLTKNGVLRELFDLGNALETTEEPLKLSKAQKVERLTQFGVQKKQMNISRSKGRAKKHDQKHDFDFEED